MHSLEVELNCTKAAKSELESQAQLLQSEVRSLQNDVSRKRELEILLEEERKKVNRMHMEVPSLVSFEFCLINFLRMSEDIVCSSCQGVIFLWQENHNF